ncbi:hypothetical protein C2845_PM09G02230 [Panicum miliaceum]|uniref:Uncharacterized protein n=1 Tax=Panicum miliaceum TaxID=4540 RepID=A0A3L6S2M7_PANMI|nr:hypothetical protein C2845_PM09G02230 [Panicum miliaceum]
MEKQKPEPQPGHSGGAADHEMYRRKERKRSAERVVGTGHGMTVAESRRSRRLQTSANAGGGARRQATARKIRCSSATRRTIRRAGASSSVKGSTQMPSSRISIPRSSCLFLLVESWQLPTPTAAGRPTSSPPNTRSLRPRRNIGTKKAGRLRSVPSLWA